MPSHELMQLSQAVPPSELAMYRIMRQISEAGTDEVSDDSKTDQINDILTPEGPYRSPEDAQYARQLVAREVLLNGPAVCRNAEEVKTWMACFEDATVHTEAAQVANVEPYDSGQRTELTIYSLLEAVAADTTVDARAEAEKLGQRFRAPATLTPENKVVPPGARAMATHAVHMRDAFLHMHQDTEQVSATREQQEARNLQMRIELSFHQIVEALTKSKALREMHELLRTTILSGVPSRDLVESAGEKIKQEVEVILQRYKDQLSAIEITKLIDTTKAIAHTTLEWVRQQPGLGELVRSEIGGLLQDIRSGIQKDHVFTNENMIRVGNRVREQINQLLPGGITLPSFTTGDIPKAALEASQLTIAWAKRQLGIVSPETLGLEAANQAVDTATKVAQTIGETVTKEPFLKEPLPSVVREQAPSLEPETAPLSLSQRLVSERFNATRNALYSVARLDTLANAAAPMTPIQLIELAQQQQYAATKDSVRLGSVAYELLSLSPERARELQAMLSEAARSVSADVVAASPLTRLLKENPALAQADVTQKGQRAVLVNDLTVARPANQSGRELDPTNPADQLQALYNVVHVVAWDMPAHGNTQTIETWRQLHADRETLKEAVQDSLRKLREATVLPDLPTPTRGTSAFAEAVREQAARDEADRVIEAARLARDQALYRDQARAYEPESR